MEHDRRMAHGRWAEVVGDPAVEQDTLMRRLGIGPSVEADIDVLNAETRSMLEAYAAGVNAFMETTRELPVEFRIADVSPEPWRPQDCLAVFKVRHILMGVFEGKLWRASLVNELGVDKAAEIIPDYPTGHLLITPPGASYTGGDWDALAQLAAGASNVSWLAEAEGGSNNWALMGSRTASGKPLVAGDPHRPLDTPNVYYQNHIACPDFDALGLSFPGCPGFPHFGPQRPRGMVRDPRPGRLPRPLRREVQPLWRVRVEGRMAEGRRSPRNYQVAGWRRDRDRRGVDAPRAGDPGRPSGIRHRQQADFNRRAECVGGVPAAHAARRVGQPTWTRRCAAGSTPATTSYSRTWTATWNT